MTDHNSKIITSFQDRLEMDSALRGLGETNGDLELREAAARLAGEYGDRLLPALLALLDTNSPQMRGGLGYVAAVLDPDSTIAALSSAARNRGLSDQARMTAITILERFLGSAPDDSMYAGMSAPAQLAVNSLQEVLSEATSNPLVFLDYFGQLSLEPNDVLLAMVRASRDLEGAEAVPLLRMFAQDPFPPAAREAVEIVGTIAHPMAAQALQELAPTLPTDLRKLALRSLQKLRLRGVATASLGPPPTGSRCLASPTDSQGNQVLWFLVPNADGETTATLQVLIDGEEGVGDASGSFSTPNTILPPTQPTGSIHPVDADRLLPLRLEAPFDYGRHRILAALDLTWRRSRYTPIAYRLFSPLLWQWSLPEQAKPPVEWPVVEPADTLALLQHPAMQSWFLQSRQVYTAAGQLLGAAETPPQEEFESTIRRTLARAFEGNDLDLEIMRRSLLAMGDWFDLSGDHESAVLARSTAQTFDDDPSQHPFLLAIAERGLRLALITLARGLRTARDSFPFV